MNVYIANRDRLSYVQKMVECINCFPDTTPVIIDNASIYPPLLAWYDSDPPVRVVRLSNNRGPLAAWSGCVDFGDSGEFFAVTDPDLDLSNIPIDLMDRLKSGLKKYEDVIKCGVSLELDDLLPGHPITPRVREWEKGFWAKKRDDQFWDADIDTTLAVYRTDRPAWGYGPSLRADRPYTARHLPWYCTAETATEEDRCYWSRLEGVLGWSPTIARIVA